MINNFQMNYLVASCRDIKKDLLLLSIQVLEYQAAGWQV